jgi:F0F1-type ATP synthase membrane subunit b/b'
MEQTLTDVLAAISLTPLDAKMIVVGTVFIFGLYRALAKGLFTPVLAHVEQRESVTEGALFTADQMRQKAQALRARYDENLLQTRIEANRVKADIVAKAKQDASAILSEAEAVAARELSAGRAAIERQVTEAKQRAESDAQELAAILSSKVDSQLLVH